MKLPSLVISQEDYQKISATLSIAKAEVAEVLEEELSRASVVPAEKLPHDVVSMQSEVTFRDLDTEQQQTVTLTYPREADIEKQRVSIFAPIGMALLGLKVGDVIEWPVSEERVRRIKVVWVLPPSQRAS